MNNGTKKQGINEYIDKWQGHHDRTERCNGMESAGDPCSETSNLYINFKDVENTVFHIGNAV